jgi:hypothetical protein
LQYFSYIVAFYNEKKKRIYMVLNLLTFRSHVFILLCPWTRAIFSLFTILLFIYTNLMHVCTIWRIYWCYWSRTNYRQLPIIANLHVTRERTRIFWPFFADDKNKWWQIRQHNLTFVSWLMKKKLGKTPLEHNTSLHKLRGDHVNGAECQSLL